MDRTIQPIRPVIERPTPLGRYQADYKLQRLLEKQTAKHDENLRLIYNPHLKQSI